MAQTVRMLLRDPILRRRNLFIKYLSSMISSWSLHFDYTSQDPHAHQVFDLTFRNSENNSSLFILEKEDISNSLSFLFQCVLLLFSISSMWSLLRFRNTPVCFRIVGLENSRQSGIRRRVKGRPDFCQFYFVSDFFFADSCYFSQLSFIIVSQISL